MLAAAESVASMACSRHLEYGFCTRLICLWFVVDPDPAGVWNEFVLGENWGKVSAGGPSYLQTALFGGFSIWIQALALFQNGAMLGPLIMAVAIWGLMQARPAWRDRLNGVIQPQAVLWIYVLLLSLFSWCQANARLATSFR